MNKEDFKKIVTQKDWVFIGEGWDNLVYANKQKTTIFRIPKKSDGVDILKMEEKVLPMLDKKNLGVTIPIPSVIEEDNFCYAKYPYVLGKQYNELSDIEKIDLIKKLGEFLHKLHDIDISLIKNISKIDYHKKYSLIFKNVKQELSDLLTDSQINYAVELFETFLEKKEYILQRESILHGDISLDHVYYHDGYISIIDWSDIHISDPAREFNHMFRSLSINEKNILIEAYQNSEISFWKLADIYTFLDTFEVLLIFVKNKQNAQIHEFLIRVEHDMLDWKLRF